MKKQRNHVSAVLHQIYMLPFSWLNLSRGKRLLIVVFSYGPGIAGLWLLYPLVHNGASMLLSIISACWLFRYRGLLITLVLNVVVLLLIYLFLLSDILPDQIFAERVALGSGISLVLGLVVCWLRATVDLMRAARQRTLAQQQESSPPFQREDLVPLSDERQFETDEHQYQTDEWQSETDERQYQTDERQSETDKRQHQANEWQSETAKRKNPLLLPTGRGLHASETLLRASLEASGELYERLAPTKQGVHPGQQVGEYRLLRELGGGGFGAVYLGEHVHEHTQAAVKVLQIPLTSGEDFKEFINEARTTRLRHPHIVPLLDFGISRNDLPYLVMEYAPEGTLRDRHPTGDRVALSTLVSYVDQLASALQYAHDHRVIHRDIKPENILVRIDGTLMVSDFGLAKLLEQNVVTSKQAKEGTPMYMAPEQHRGYPCFASDQYALAVVTYEWLCGVRPFLGTALGLVIQHMHAPPPSLRDRLPTLPEAVERVIFKALAKAPEERFERIQGFADALREAM